MKKSILFLFFATLTISNVLASTNPVEDAKLTLINDSAVELTVSSDLQKEFFLMAEFDQNLDALEFVTKDFVNYIQIYDAQDELKYQLPVMSKKLKISRKMFKSGAYKIAFLTKNNKSIQFTNLTVN